MATMSLDGLAAELSALGLKSTLLGSDELPESHYLHRPLDVWRAYLAQRLSEFTGCNIITTYEAVQTTSTPAAGGLTLPVPRLRLKLKTPNELCAELASPILRRGSSDIKTCTSRYTSAFALETSRFTTIPRPVHLPAWWLVRQGPYTWT